MPSLLSWLRRIYSLDTLDTRFTTAATTPANADTRPPKDARANVIAQRASAPLWRTPEFFVYYLFFITLVPLMFKTVIDASKGEHSESLLAKRRRDANGGSSKSCRKPPCLPNLFSPSLARLDPWTPSREYLNRVARYLRPGNQAPADPARMTPGQLRRAIRNLS